MSASRVSKLFRFAASIFGWCAFITPVAYPGFVLADYRVTIDTTAITSTTVALAFDFIDGGPPSNAVTVSQFTNNGMLGAAIQTGGVVGTLPAGFALSDSAFFKNTYKVSMARQVLRSYLA